MSKNNFWDDPDIQGWLNSVSEDMIPKMKSSSIALAVCNGTIDAQISVQIGAAILLDKPLIVVLPDVCLAPALERAATAIVRGDPHDAETKAKLLSALSAHVPRRA